MHVLLGQIVLDASGGRGTSGSALGPCPDVASAAGCRPVRDLVKIANGWMSHLSHQPAPILLHVPDDVGDEGRK